MENKMENNETVPVPQGPTMEDARARLAVWSGLPMLGSPGFEHDETSGEYDAEGGIAIAVDNFAAVQDVLKHMAAKIDRLELLLAMSMSMDADKQNSLLILLKGQR